LNGRDYNALIVRNAVEKLEKNWVSRFSIPKIMSLEIRCKD